MEPLAIKSTTQTPSIQFDGGNGQLCIAGKSYSENVSRTYRPLLDYLDVYLTHPQQNMQVEFKWHYFNTATMKIMVDMLQKLKNVGEVKIKWVCKQKLTYLIEKGQELSELLDLDIEIVFED